MKSKSNFRNLALASTLFSACLAYGHGTKTENLKLELNDLKTIEEEMEPEQRPVVAPSDELAMEKFRTQLQSAWVNFLQSEASKEVELK